ncbi:MAG TPA: F0F1 ATP synthase subunit B [Actinomycetota bacterium]|nr:F0F1 ATP synthase subunit B [Actinomycetota bacterium]
MLAALLAAAEEPVPPLKILPAADELIWGSIAFFLLLIALLKFVFPKAKAALAERTAKIQGQVEEAERTKREADQVLEQYRQQLADARSEVAKIIDEGKKTADSLRAELVAKAEKEAQDIVSRARADVAGERDRVMAELRSTLGDLSIQLASRVIEKELASSDTARALVDRAISDLSRSSGSN